MVPTEKPLMRGRCRGCVARMSVRVLVLVIVAVVADETDVDAHEKREYERLHEADEYFEKVERNRQSPLADGRHRVQQIFAAEDIAEKTNGERNWPEDDRNDFDESDREEDREQRIVNRGRGVALVGLVAED